MSNLIPEPMISMDFLSRAPGNLVPYSDPTGQTRGYPTALGDMVNLELGHVEGPGVQDAHRRRRRESKW